MSHKQTNQIDSLYQQANAFWQAWQQQSEYLNTLPLAERVEAGNALLHQYIENIYLEIQQDSPKDTIVFSANGILENFITVDIILRTATTQDYHLVAFRQRLPDTELNKFIIGMSEDLTLSAQDLLINIETDEQFINIKICINKPATEEQLVHLKNMAFIMLDHILGEWDFAIKIGLVEFIEQPENGAITADQLPSIVNDLWNNTLQHNGQYPDAENSQWAVAQCEESETQDGLVFIRNQSASALLGKANMAWCVMIHSDITCEEDFEQARHLEDTFFEKIAENQKGIGVLSEMNFTQGHRTIYVFCQSYQDGISIAESVVRLYPDLNSTIDSQYDPAWRYYQI